MATNLCHQNGRMEYWNVEDPDFIGAGILGVKAEIKHLNCKKLLQTHHSITPSFHYSNWGEAPKFYYVVMINKANLKLGEIMMLGGHISCCKICINQKYNGLVELMFETFSLGKISSGMLSIKRQGRFKTIPDIRS